MGDGMFDLSGRTALVTGAATGLGRAIAVGLAEAGADVIGVCHRSPAAETEAAVRATGRRFLNVTGDLATSAGARGILSEALRQSPQIDILVNNAGIIRRADFVDFGEADWDEVMDVNLKSLFLLSQAFVRHRLERGGRGKIIHIASMLSFQGGIRVPSYTAAKHGVLGLTRLMANELAARGINVNAIAPGYMATDNTLPLRQDPVRNPQILARIPAGRWGDPDDIRGAAVFLASRASDYVHGTTITVDGGWMAR